MTYSCGPSDGRLPSFAFKGQQYSSSSSSPAVRKFCKLPNLLSTLNFDREAKRRRQHSYLKVADSNPAGVTNKSGTSYFLA
jgi:hypothetical protein